MDHVVVYLVPVGRHRFELYAEPPAEPHPDDLPRGWFARLRHRAMRLALATVGSDRTLWALRRIDRATLAHSADMSAAAAASERDRLLARALRRQVWWLAVDAVLMVPSVLLTVIPGPNVIGYYVAARGIGHFFAWRGASRATHAAWDLRAEPALEELSALADLPRDVRASRVDAVAARLRLPSLSAFFDRAAVPARS